MSFPQPWGASALASRSQALASTRSTMASRVHTTRRPKASWAGALTASRKVTPVALHSITLLTAILQSSEFLSAIQKHPELLPRLFSGMFKQRPNLERRAGRRAFSPGSAPGLCLRFGKEGPVACPLIPSHVRPPHRPSPRDALGAGHRRGRRGDRRQRLGRPGRASRHHGRQHQAGIPEGP